MHAPHNHSAPPAETFAALLAALVDRYGTRQAVGALVGLSGSRVGRAMAGQYSFSVAHCLALAERTGLSASRVLRAAGKGAIADLIERLYGPPAAAPVSAAERDVLDRWRALPPTDRALVADLVRRLVPPRRRPRA